jgi:uncharacterized protein
MEVGQGFVVEQVWRYPVKSVGGERIGASLVDARGLVGDRLWAVRDADGKLGSGKDSRRFRRMVGLLQLSARFLAEPAGPGEPASPARPSEVGIGCPVIVGPDGSQHPVSTGAADGFLREMTGLPHVQVSRESDVSHFDEVPLSMIGTATLAWLQEQLPEVAIEIRRFRANLVIRTDEPFAEESWLGRTVRIGTGDDAVQAVFDRVLQRCVMVGMAQPGLSESGAVLKRLGQREDHPVCLALGGAIAHGGTVRVGDPVTFS